MNFSVAAEFDSVDMADLASGRIRSIPGIISLEVLRNRYAAESDDNSGVILPPTPTGATWANMGVFPGGAYYPTSLVPDFNGHSSEEYEPARRRDALLKIVTTSETTANRVSSVLRNVGGRNVRIFQN